MQTTTTPQQELLEVERRFWQAIKDKDAHTALALTDFPCIVTGAQGVRLLERGEFERLLKDASYRITKADLRDVQVRMLRDDVALVGYTVHEELIVEGKPVAFDAADLSTWIRRDGEWRCAAHAESIAGDPFGRDR